jgi:predicted nucleic acid-binding Zn ribbon protein
MNTCEHCDAPLTGNQVRWCSRRCNENANHFKRYHSDPEHRERKLARNQVYQQLVRAQRNLKGLCVRCGQVNDTEGKTCSECIRYAGAHK